MSRLSGTIDMQVVRDVVCPIDRKRIERRKYGIQAFSTNEDIMRQMLEKENPQQSSSKEGEEKSVEGGEMTHKIEKCLQHNEESYEASSKSVQAQEPIRFEMCLLHSKPAQLICLEDKCLICANCGLFGQHKHHSLLPFDTFATKFSTNAEQCLSTLELLKEKQSQLSQNSLSQRLDLLIAHKKQEETKNIKKNINYFIDIVREYEKELKLKLDAQLMKRKAKLMEQAKFERLLSKKQQFEKDFELMQKGITDLLHMENIETYLQFVDQNSAKSYLNKEGEYLLLEIENHEKILKEQIQQTINQVKFKLHPNPKQLIQTVIYLNSAADHKNIKAQQQKQKKTEQIIVASCYKKQTPKKSKKEDDLLLRCSNEGEVNRSPDCPKEMSPIKPIPNFEETFDDKFRQQYKQSIITQGSEQNFLRVTSISLTQTQKKNNRYSMASKRPSKKQQEKSVIDYSKPKSNNSSHIVQREILNVLNERNANKRRKKLQLPPKFAKIYDDLVKDRVDVLDLGGAFLGDATILNIAELIPTRTRLKSVKLMNNKITDEVLPELVLSCKRIHSLNLSYNCLSERSLDWLQSASDNLGGLSNITLSNNKIVLRNVKDRLQNLKRKGLKISL